MPDNPFLRLVALASSILPGLLLTLAFFRLSRWRLPPRLFGVALASGALVSLIPALLSVFEKVIAVRLAPLTGSFVNAFVFAGLFEETAKLVAILFIVRPHFACRSKIDIVLGAATVALGFALVENAFFVLGSKGSWQVTAFSRAVSSVPAHALMGLYLGYGLVKSEEEKDVRILYFLSVAAALLATALLHGFYDFPLFLRSQAPLYPTAINQLAVWFHMPTSLFLSWLLTIAILLICIQASRAIYWLKTQPISDEARTSQAIKRNWFVPICAAPTTGIIATAATSLAAIALADIAYEAIKAGALSDLASVGYHWSLFLLVVSAAFACTLSPQTVPLHLRLNTSGRSWIAVTSWLVIGVGIIGLKLFSGGPRQSAVARVLLESGIVYETTGSPENALRNFDAARNYVSNPVAVHALKADADFKLRRYDAALSDINLAIKEAPNTGAFYKFRSEVYSNIHQKENALADINHALALQPNNLEFLTTRGQLLLEQGQSSQAERDFKQAIQLNPKDADGHLGLAALLDKNDKFADALAELQIAAKIAPTRSEVWSWAGRLNYDHGQFLQAAKDFTTAVSLEKAQSIYDVLWLYMARARAGQNGVSELRFWLPLVPRAAWPNAVLELFLGLRTTQSVFALAPDDDARCEARFYVGEYFLLQNANVQALPLLKAALHSCPTAFFEYDGAKAELKRLEDVSQASKPPIPRSGTLSQPWQSQSNANAIATPIARDPSSPWLFARVAPHAIQQERPVRPQPPSPAELPLKFESLLQGSFQFAGRTYPLPSGNWRVVASLPGTTRTGVKFDMKALSNESNGRLVGLILMIGNDKTTPETNGFHPGGFCEHSDLIFTNIITNEDHGNQDCQYIDFLSPNDTWRFAKDHLMLATLGDLKGRHIVLPTAWLEVAFRFADRETLLNARYYFDPEAAGIPPAPNVNWIDSEWNRYNLPKHANKFQYVERLKTWLAKWEVILRAGWSGSVSTVDAADLVLPR